MRPALIFWHFGFNDPYVAQALKPYADMAHTVTHEELNDALTFLNRCLPGETKEPDEMSVKELKKAIKDCGLGAEAQGLFEKHELLNLLKSNKSNKPNKPLSEDTVILSEGYFPL